MTTPGFLYQTKTDAATVLARIQAGYSIVFYSSSTTYNKTHTFSYQTWYHTKTDAATVLARIQARYSIMPTTKHIILGSVHLHIIHFWILNPDSLD